MPSRNSTIAAPQPLYRSVLYIPASNERAMQKAHTLAADAIIFDLEEAVAASAKAQARGMVRAALQGGGYGARQCIVRINGLDTEWGEADARMVQDLPCDGVLLPKVESREDIAALAERVADCPLWAMMETARGVLHAAEIAEHPRVRALVMGTNDLTRELRAQPRPDRLPLLGSLGLCLLAARAHGCVSIDGVHNALRDADGLRAECMQGRDMGFDGKSVIHPAQIAIANAVFAPSGQELALARRQLEAFAQAQAQGLGVAVVDGRIVENLHVSMAREVLAKAAAIAALEQQENQ
ncbi:MAG: CoA ester lyase [Rhodobacteraceae bacterium]|nr:CoA ester lyase [Paracoccaceae bacterium]